MHLSNRDELQDIKPNNLLYTSGGVLKLADFGLARSFAEPYQLMSTQVITRWYRPPELFYGAQHYSGAVDVWSMGIIFIELVKHASWITGETDAQQIIRIAQYFGAPTEANWPGVSLLPHYVVPEEVRPEADRGFWRREYPQLGPEGQLLLSQILRLDPRKRCTAKEALDSDWFRIEPYPTKPHKLPIKVDAEGEEKAGQDLKRRAGMDEFMDGTDMDMGGRGKKLARKLDFGGM